MHDQAEERSSRPDGRPDAEQPAWRQEFPVDLPQDNYIARRDFTKFLVLTSCAFVAGQGWIGVQSLLRSKEPKPEAKLIPGGADLPIGGFARFNFPSESDPCLLIRQGPVKFVAFSQKCTHLGCEVIPDADGSRLLCPCHEGLFDAADGRPLAGPPRRPLPQIKLETRGGELFATGVEEHA